MKFNLSFLVLLMPLAVTFTSCKKDKDEPSNYFTYEGKTYQTTIAQNASEGDITSTTFASATPGQTSGKVSMINIMFWTTSLQPGTYSYKDFTDETFDAAKHFAGAFALIDVEYSNQGSGTTLESITAGTVTIAKDGTNYNVTYELNFDGKSVSGKYSGAIQQVN